MRGVLLVLLLGAVGVLEAQTPPLASYVYAQNPQYPPDSPTVDWGMSSINTDELWRKFTLLPKADETQPMIDECYLNGATEPVTLIGKTMVTWLEEKPIYAFQGIMYGEAMTGDSRFKKTIQKAPYWGNDTELLLDHLGEKCPQKSMIGGVPSGNEDCLSLNVYTPILPGDPIFREPLPVMVFIHGGAFISGDTSLYLPTKLLNDDVILVVIQYRLGNLGFFSLDNDDAPGNAGLWDQITALEWVRDNIACFGGDPDKVTIFGEGAGSASVNWLMLLPRAEGSPTATSRRTPCRPWGEMAASGPPGPSPVWELPRPTSPLLMKAAPTLTTFYKDMQTSSEEEGDAEGMGVRLGQKKKKKRTEQQSESPVHEPER